MTSSSQSSTETTAEELNRRAAEHAQEVGKRHRVAQSLRDTLVVLNSQQPLDEILAYLVGQASTLLEANACVIHRVSIDDSFVHNQASFGLPHDLAAIPGFRLHSSRNDEIILNRQPVVVSKISDDIAERIQLNPDPDPHVQLWRERTVKLYPAMVALPLVINDGLYGSIIFYYTSPQQFTEETISTAETFAEQAALAIENARLYQAAQDRTREADLRRLVAESLRETLNVVNSNRPLPEILSYIAEQANKVAGARGCIIHRYDAIQQYVHIEARFGMPEGTEDYTGFPIASPSGQDYAGSALARRISPNNFPSDPTELFSKHPDLDHATRERWLLVMSEFAATLLIPLIIKDELFGSMVFYYKEPQAFTEEELGLASTFAEQTALAIENARLYQAEQDRRRESERRRQIAESLRDILAVLNSRRPLQEILEYIVSQASQLLDSAGGALYTFDQADRMLTLRAGYGLPESMAEIGSMHLYEGGGVQKMFDREPYILEDIQSHLADPAQRSATTMNDPKLIKWASILNQNYRAYMGMPLIINNEVFGNLSLYYDRSRQFTEEERSLALAFAEQAGMAIENARLYDQAQLAAAAAERNRLARDLHDSVTQTLFSASLIAKVLPRLWERDPDEGWKRLDELHQLTRGALAEMRTLLLELRPAALEDTEMHQLLRHLVEATMGRAGIPISLTIDCDAPLSNDLKLVFYRIAQEALTNVAKHADANQAEVCLCCNQMAHELVITDDGCGFDPVLVAADHLGLGIMQERARSIGADLSVMSELDHGTTIRVVWQRPQKEETGNGANINPRVDC